MDKTSLMSRLRQAIGLPPRPRDGRKYACCRQAQNMRQQDTGRGDLALEVCVCGRRHFTVRVDPGQLGLSGRSIGEKPTGRFVKA